MSKIKDFYRENKKSTLIIYLLLRLLVIISLIAQIIHQNWDNVFLCILTLVLFTIPYFIDRKLNIELPNALEIIILLFIFSAEILGEIQNFYGIFHHWDTILHTLNGFLCAAIGFSLIDILNRNVKTKLKLSPIYVAMVAFCFSMTIGVLWEFFEYSGDKFLGMDMQKDTMVQNVSSVALNPEKVNRPVKLENVNKVVIYSKDKEGNEIETIVNGGYLDIGLNDTMKDLLVNLIGAITFSIIGFLYIKNRDEYHFAQNFIPKVRKEK